MDYVAKKQIPGTHPPITHMIDRRVGCRRCGRSTSSFDDRLSSGRHRLEEWTTKPILVKHFHGRAPSFQQKSVKNTSQNNTKHFRECCDLSEWCLSNYQWEVCVGVHSKRRMSLVQRGTVLISQILVRLHGRALRKNANGKPCHD